MSIRNKNDIRVYSELPFQINLIGQHRSYIFPACADDQPTMNYVDWADIEFANSRGNIFSSGLLIFDESEQEEIYNELHIRDWRQKVWFDKDIVEAIEHPTLESMQRIIDIKNSLVFERIRGKVVYYTNHNKNISQNVVNIVNARYRELNAGVLGSKIVLKPVDIEKPATVEEVNDLKRQLEEMQSLMKKMVAAQTASTDSKANAPDDQAGQSNPKTQAAAKRPTRKTVVKK